MILSWRPALHHIASSRSAWDMQQDSVENSLKMSLERKMGQNDFDVSSLSDSVFPSTKEMELKRTMSF